MSGSTFTAIFELDQLFSVDDDDEDQLAPIPQNAHEAAAQANSHKSSCKCWRAASTRIDLIGAARCSATLALAIQSAAHAVATKGDAWEEVLSFHHLHS